METIQIFDTTLRDGEQAPGCSMNLQEKIEVAHCLEKLKVDKVHVLMNGQIVEEGGAELIEDINSRGFTHILEAQPEAK